MSKQFRVAVTINATDKADAEAFRDELAQRVEDMNDADVEEIGSTAAGWVDSEVYEPTYCYKRYFDHETDYVETCIRKWDHVGDHSYRAIDGAVAVTR